MAQPDGRERRRWKIRHVFLLLLLILLGWFAFFRISVHRHLTRRMAELRAQGYALTMENLDRSYRLPAGAENAADCYLTAFSYYDPGDDEAREGVPWVNRSTASPGRTESLAPEIRERAERFLAANEETLALLHEAVGFEACRYPMDFSTDFGAGVPWLSEVRRNAFLLALEGLVACERGDPNQAIASVHAISDLARSVNSPVLIHYLVRIAVQAIAFRSTECIVNRAALTDAQLQSLSGWLESPDDSKEFAMAFVGERCFGADVFRGSTQQLAQHISGNSKLLSLFIVPRKILGLHDRDMLSYINLLQDYIDVAGLPVRERLARSETLEKESNGSRRLGLLTRMLVPALARVAVLSVRRTAHQWAAQTTLAIERYRLARGRLPETLSELVPAYLDTVPQDPFDAQELRYRRLETGYVVYSVGDDRTDNGGAEKDARQRNNQGEVVWDVTFFVER